MRDIKKTDELMFISHFPTHSTVWHLLEVDDDIDNPTEHTKDMIAKGFAFQSRNGKGSEKGKIYLINCNHFWTSLKAIEFYSTPCFPEFHNTWLQFLTDERPGDCCYICKSVTMGTCLDADCNCHHS